MALVEKGTYDDNPHIPENYYISTLSNIRDYARDDAEAPGLILNFTVEHDGQEHDIPFFAPAKLSVSEERESSRLAENLAKVGLLEPVLEVLECKDEIMSEQHKWIAADENEIEDIKNALNAVFNGKKVRVDVEDDQSGEASTVGKLSKVFEEGDETADSADGGAADL